MPDLRFAIQSAEAVPFAVLPTITFKLEVTNGDPTERVHSGMLRAQIQIDASRRRYSAEEQARLFDLFGEPERWSTTLRSMLWTHQAVSAIATERQANGPFRDIFDLAERVDPKQLTKGVLEILIKAEASSTASAWTAGKQLALVDRAVQGAALKHRDKAAGQKNLFGGDERPRRHSHPRS